MEWYQIVALIVILFWQIGRISILEDKVKKLEKDLVENLPKPSPTQKQYARDGKFGEFLKWN